MLFVTEIIIKKKKNFCLESKGFRCHQTDYSIFYILLIGSSVTREN